MTHFAGSQLRWLSIVLSSTARLILFLQGGILTWIFVALDLGIMINTSNLCFGKDTHWQKQHGNLSTIVQMLLPQFLPFINNGLIHIWGWSDARGGVLVKVVFAFIHKLYMVLWIMCATAYYWHYRKPDKSWYYGHECSYLCRCRNHYAAVDVSTWKITLDDYL